MIQYDIIKRPLITEKTTIQKESFNQVSFEVNPAANRVEIKRAIENIFKVKVARVQTLQVTGGQLLENEKTGKRRSLH
jgi:large subunit ribosomal protein L23